MTDDGYWLASRDLPDGRIGHIVRMIFTYRLTVALIEEDPYGYDDSWCYHDLARAQRALEEWDGTGEPEGWHRHPDSGRRRPDGDPAREFVRQ